MIEDIYIQLGVNVLKYNNNRDLDFTFPGIGKFIYKIFTSISIFFIVITLMLIWLIVIFFTFLFSMIGKVVLRVRNNYKAPIQTPSIEFPGNFKQFKGSEFIPPGSSVQLKNAYIKTSDELLNSQSYVENIIGSMDNSLIVLSPDKKIKKVNKSTAELLGYSEDELIGMDMKDVLQDDPFRGIGIEYLIDKGSFKNTPAEYITRDKGKISVSFSGSVVYDKANEVQYIICLAHDITERKEAEAAIIRVHDELEIRVAERTFELEETNKTLISENKERLEAEKKLLKSLGEKEVLLKEVHHRVKNNLQVISSLLQLNSMKIKDKDALEVFRASQIRIKSIAMVHERLYQSNDLVHIDFKDYINVLTRDLFRLFGVKASTISLSTNICHITLDIDKTIALGLIINELVTNSIKYAFPNQASGEMKIDILNPEADKYEFIYKDNGIGLPKDIDFSKLDSLGLRLIQGLTSQIDGVMEINNNNGVEFKITFTGEKQS